MTVVSGTLMAFSLNKVPDVLCIIREYIWTHKFIDQIIIVPFLTLI